MQKYLVTLQTNGDLAHYIRNGDPSTGKINIVTLVKMIRSSTGTSLRLAKAFGDAFRDKERSYIDVEMSEEKFAEFMSRYILTVNHKSALIVEDVVRLNAVDAEIL